MTQRSGSDLNDEGLASALRRFPTHAPQIRDLIMRNENFRTICDDLACAEQALLAVDRLQVGIREARRREFKEMVDTLSTEIERLLTQTKVINISGWHDKQQ
ncbi:hypothetical protein FPY71_14840 [Aureimonas fodinaquatilis]|uniref:Uncharacterized protein n=1 Tax=Aureimonas fodinaquatilis TaxID=2565783 RepID=A0A5B0DV08_9HYPH|nr:hypothetical protein [Aureimonas fodinaquatilis]KAA0969785.1 hypothetical protein FPY71_14840 [Aureimonas fodinaquatilis]